MVARPTVEQEIESLHIEAWPLCTQPTHALVHETRRPPIAFQTYLEIVTLLLPYEAQQLSTRSQFFNSWPSRWT
jgi:hypothetical protein